MEPITKEANAVDSKNKFNLNASKMYLFYSRAMCMNNLT